MIQFGVWAPSQETFWNTWIDAGICSAPNEFKPPYAGCIETTCSVWDGIVVKEGIAVPGWHCNVRISGALADQFTAGLPSCDSDGNLLSVWNRTHAASAFSLTLQQYDPVTGFPAGMRSASGVTYADVNDFSSPANQWT